MSAIELFFDDAADAAIRRAWDRLETAGLPTLATRSHRRHHPHVSLAVGDGLDVDLCPLVADLPALPVLHFGAVGTFGGTEGVVFLMPRVTAELLAVHEALHCGLAKHGLQLWEHYLPGRLVPHCTVGYGLSPDQVGTAVGMLSRELPLSACVASINLVDLATGDATRLR
ncbi:MAG: 2'-5' RNA ligase family protein [Mycobacteriales bacterium]